MANLTLHDDADAPATISGQAWPGVNYFCTTRAGGGSRGVWTSFNLGEHAGDDPTDVAANRQVLRAGLPGEPCWLRQVHGAAVWDADLGCHAVCPTGTDGAAHIAPDGAAPPPADASITQRPGQVLAILTADCLPIVIASSDGTALGVAHAGWKGLAAGVLENTLGCLRKRAPQAASWRAWIGPGIGQAHFEVGGDVLDAFICEDADARTFFAARPAGGKWLADLAGLARYRLQRAGVSDIELSGECTYRRDRLYYSYRREHVTGRMATLAWLTGASDLP